MRAELLKHLGQVFVGDAYELRAIGSRKDSTKVQVSVSDTHEENLHGVLGIDGVTDA